MTIPFSRKQNHRHVCCIYLKLQTKHFENIHLVKFYHDGMDDEGDDHLNNMNGHMNWSEWKWDFFFHFFCQNKKQSNKPEFAGETDVQQFFINFNWILWPEYCTLFTSRQNRILASIKTNLQRRPIFICSNSYKWLDFRYLMQWNCERMRV